MRTPRRGLLALALLVTPAFTAWNQVEEPSSGAGRLAAEVISRQIALRFQSGESDPKVVAFFASTNGPIFEMAELTNARLIERLRLKNGGATYIPPENGIYHFAALVYRAIDGSNRQSYLLIPGENGVTVDWVPPAFPMAALLAQAALARPVPAPQVAPVETSNVVTNRGAAGSTYGASNLAPASNQARVPEQAPVAAAPVVAAQVLAPSIVMPEWPAWMKNSPFAAPPTNQGPTATEKALESLVPPMKALVEVISNVMNERRSFGPSNTEITRKDWFKADPDGASEAELLALVKELRELGGTFVNLRLESTSLGDLETYALLVRAWGAAARTQRALAWIAEKGWKWSWWERIQGESASFHREVTAFWRKILERYKVPG